MGKPEKHGKQQQLRNKRCNSPKNDFLGLSRRKSKKTEIGRIIDNMKRGVVV